jgi:hypothetical protein
MLLYRMDYSPTNSHVSCSLVDRFFLFLQTIAYLQVDIDPPSRKERELC